MINEIHTSCRACCFAIWNKDTQIGCHANQISNFRSKGAEVLEVYDDKKEFFVINNRLCKYSRSQKWKERQSNKNISNLISKAKEEIRFKYQLIINYNTLDNLKKTLDSVLDQTVLPAQMNIIRPYLCEDMPSKIIGVLKGVKVPWKINSLIQNNNFYDGVDIAVHNSSIPYYSLINAGFEISDNSFYQKIESKINNDLLQFGLLKGDEFDNLTIINFPFHYFMNGNKEKPLEQKFIEEGLECQKISEILQ